METNDNLRARIENLDRELVLMLERRAELVKQNAGADPDLKREGSRHLLAARVDDLVRGANGVFPEDGLRRVFTEILSWCGTLEEPCEVAFLGPEGTFSHQAALAAFGSGVKFVPLHRVDDIFGAVEKRNVHHGVVAIENSTGGVVHDVLDRFLMSDVRITSELVLYIRHCLISRLPLDQIRRVFSHPQPFMQCRTWLRAHLPNVTLIEVSSTVEGVRRAAESGDGAAIGSDLAARLNGMDILAANIQDQSDNFTRFVTLGRKLPEPTGSDKTSLILSIKHQPGSLFDALKPFRDRGVNLSKIESRPSRQRPWEYVFFIDFEGHVAEESVRELLQDLERNTLFVRFLGSYPRARAII